MYVSLDPTPAPAPAPVAATAPAEEAPKSTAGGWLFAVGMVAAVSGILYLTLNQKGHRARK